MGVGLYYFSPVLYTDISDAWLFPKRYQRLITHGAGLMMNFFLTSLALLLLLVGRANYWLMMIIAITFLASFVSVLVNFNPLIKLDGYYLLADAFGIDNLRDKAFSALFSSIQQVGYTLGLFKTPPLRRPGRNAHPRLETAFLFIFGLISFTYSLLLIPFILTRYTQLLTHMLGNWGWALNAVVLVLLVIAPVLRIWQSWQKIKRQRMMVQPYLLNKPEAALGKDP